MTEQETYGSERVIPRVVALMEKVAHEAGNNAGRYHFVVTRTNTFHHPRRRPRKARVQKKLQDRLNEFQAVQQVQREFTQSMALRMMYFDDYRALFAEMAVKGKRIRNKYRHLYLSYIRFA
jgi:hypothetical protein